MPDKVKTQEESSDNTAIEKSVGGALKTDWANDTTEGSFDRDQFEINVWASSPTDHRTEVLVSMMSIADAEELVATCEAVAEEHRLRADQAMVLAESIISRLGYKSSAKSAGA